MILEFIVDVTKLALIVASLSFALRAYMRRRRPVWSDAVQKRRLAILVLLVLALSAIKVGEDVLGEESGPVDEVILMFIHNLVPSSLIGVFGAVTLTGSAMALFPLAIASTVALLLAKRRREALLLGASVVSGAAVVYAAKTLTGRARPALWETDWYWGSSFPSGHTLMVAAFATAAALCISKIWPAAGGVALSIAVLWISLVAVSRLVLGVHWPTDVLAAACIGASLPLAMSVALELTPQHRSG